MTGLASRTAVAGVVTAARPRLRGPDSVTFAYTYDGREYVGRIFGSERYDVGERVTVYVDPRRPASAPPDEQPQSRAGYVLTLLMVTASLILVGAALT